MKLPLPLQSVTTPACPICGVQITIHQKLNPSHCGSRLCMSQHAMQAHKSRKAADQAEQQERINTVKSTRPEAIAQAIQALDTDYDDLQIVSVPFQNRPLTPTSHAVRTEFLAHLDTVVPAALAAFNEATVNQTPRVAPDPPTTPTPAEAAGCAACQGLCCREGAGRNAFLSIGEIEAQFRAHSDMNIEDMVARYAAAIPDASVEGACVYQSRDGCVLERAWRSTVCNTYRCHSLIALSNLAASHTDVPLAIAASDGDGTKVLAYRESLGTLTLSKGRAMATAGTCGKTT